MTSIASGSPALWGDVRPGAGKAVVLAFGQRDRIGDFMWRRVT